MIKFFKKKSAIKRELASKHKMAIDAIERMNEAQARTLVKDALKCLPSILDIKSERKFDANR